MCNVEYPCPLWSVRNRDPLFGDVGHTIMNLLAVSSLLFYARLLLNY